MGRSRIWRTRRAKVRRGRYRRWRGARQAWPVPQPTRANPNRASWSAGRHERDLLPGFQLRLVLPHFVQAFWARHPATRLRLGFARSRAAALAKVRNRYLVETREHGQVVTRNGDQGDECAEQQDVGDWNAGKRRRARTPKREALQVAPSTGREGGQAIEAG